MRVYEPGAGQPLAQSREAVRRPRGQGWSDEALGPDRPFQGLAGGHGEGGTRDPQPPPDFTTATRPSPGGQQRVSVLARAGPGGQQQAGRVSPPGPPPARWPSSCPVRPSPLSVRAGLPWPRPARPVLGCLPRLALRPPRPCLAPKRPPFPGARGRRGSSPDCAARPGLQDPHYPEYQVSPSASRRSSEQWGLPRPPCPGQPMSDPSPCSPASS